MAFNVVSSSSLAEPIACPGYVAESLANPRGVHVDLGDPELAGGVIEVIERGNVVARVERIVELSVVVGQPLPETHLVLDDRQVRVALDGQLAATSCIGEDPRQDVENATGVVGVSPFEAVGQPSVVVNEVVRFGEQAEFEPVALRERRLDRLRQGNDDLVRLGI